MPEKDNGGRFAPSTPPMGGGSADLGLLLMALIWGVNFPVIKAALAEIPPMAFNALRFPLASLTVLLIIRIRGELTWPERVDLPRVFLLGFLGNVLYQGFFIFGLDGTLAGNASILLATIPVWTLSLSTLRRHEARGAMVWVGIGGTLLGMVLVVLGGNLSLGLQRGTLPGDLLMVGAAMTWATYAVGSRNLVRKYGALPVTAWTLWIGSAGLVVLGLPDLFHAPLADVSGMAWGGVFYAGVMAVGLAYILWNRGVRRIGSSRTAAYQNLVPVVALLVAWAWLGEKPTGLQIGGAAVILAGVSLARMGQ
ncbi:MAG: DMT family transporter [Gemmatimonadota bacterium]